MNARRRSAAGRKEARRIATDIAKPRNAFKERTPASRRLDDGKLSYSNTSATSDAEITPPAAMMLAMARRSRARARP